jgi:transcription elongation GreA/GreB family factor
MSIFEVRCHSCGRRQFSHNDSCRRCGGNVASRYAPFDVELDSPRSGSWNIARPRLFGIKDFALLEMYARTEAEPEIGAALTDLLDEGTVVDQANMPDNVVRLRSFVRFRLFGEVLEEGILMLPGPECVDTDNALPISTPIGLALLGMECGQRAHVRRADSERLWFELVTVRNPDEGSSAHSFLLGGNVVPFRAGSAASRPSDDDPGPFAA